MTPTRYMLLKTVTFPLEAAILLIAGMTMLIAGILLFPISTGVLPYYENGLHGLLLVIFALQAIALGKTPFGDLRRSRSLLAVGATVAAVGIVTCFIPLGFVQISRVLVSLCFGLGGVVLLGQMVFSRAKLRSWARLGGIFRHLILGCGAVYILSILIGLLTWMPRRLPTQQVAIVVLVFGAAIVYLAGVLIKVYALYPEAQTPPAGDGELSFDKTMLLLTGIFMLILGVLLIPVNMGLLPFSGSAQLGLLMVIFAIQMLASGSTPIGPFPRSILMIVFGFLFAAVGIVSCIIPEILVWHLTILVGLLNISGGAVTLGRTFIPLLIKPKEPRGPWPPIMKKLHAATLIMNLVTILFGTSMLVSNFIPGLIIGVILTANGCVLLYLLKILIVLEKIPSSMPDPA